MIHTLKRRFVFLAFLGLTLIMLGMVTSAYSAGNLSFGFKLGGGLGYLFNGAGDLEKMRLGAQNYATDWVEPNYTSTFDWKKVSFVPDFRFEAQVRFNGFGVGLGTGYVFLTSKGEYSLDHLHTEYPWWGEYTHQYDDVYNRTYKLTAIPISLNFYYFLPVDGMDMYVFAGPSIYFGSLNHDFLNNYDESYVDSSWYYWNEAYNYEVDVVAQEKGTCTAFGFQGGIGLEIPISPNFSLAVEAYGRFASFSNWKGDWTADWDYFWEEYFEPWGWWYSSTWTDSAAASGTWWFDEYYVSWSGNWYGEMWVSTTAPSGSYYRNIKEASVNLNSIGIMFSGVIRF